MEPGLDTNSEPRHSLLPLRDMHTTNTDTNGLTHQEQSKHVVPEASSSASADNEAVSWQQSAVNKSTTQTLLRTTVIVLTYAAMGMAVEIAGASMEELQRRTGTDSAQMAQAMKATDLACMLSCLPLGLVLDQIRGYSFLLTGLGSMLCLLACVVLPSATNLTHLTSVFALLGVGEILVLLATHALILDLWTERATGPLHILHAGYGIGSMLVTLLVRAFMPTARASGHSASLITSGNDRPFPNTTWNSTYGAITNQGYPVERAYFILAALSGLCAMAMIAYQALEYRHCRSYCLLGKAKQCSDKTESDARCFSTVRNAVCPAQAHLVSQMCLVSLVVILATFCTMQSNGLEHLYGRFAVPIGIEYFHFSPEDSITIGTVYWAFYTVGRLTFALSGFFKMTSVLALDGIGVLASACCIYYFNTINLNVVLFIYALTGFFGGPLVPLAVSWMNALMDVKGLYMTIVFFGQMAGGFFYLWLSEVLLERHGFSSILALGVAGSVFVTVIFIAMFTLSCVVRRKHSSGRLLPDEQYQHLS